MRVHLAFLGCKLNRSELERWERELRALGHQIVPSPEEADVCIVNTCTVTHIASHKSRQLIRRLHRANPAARIVVTGCYAEVAPYEVEALEGVDLVVSNLQKEKLPELITGTAPDQARPIPPTPGRTRAFVKVQDGCDNHCTYCIIRVARGFERSRPIQEVVDEINALVDVGYKEIVLTGVHLGGYGKEWELSLYDLVKAVLERTAVPRLRLSSIEPWDIRPEFFELWQDPRLCRHLHLPLQSGCDATLKRMGRRYTAAQYAAIIKEARTRISDIAITTDVMVGFPGETEEEFRQSVRFIEEMQFARIHVFAYSPRPGTPAARMKGHLPAHVKKERERIVAELGRRSEEAFRKRFLGRTMEVLWETPRPQGELYLCTGLTDNYIRVYALSPHPLTNVITPVHLLRLKDRGVEGEVLEMEG